MNSTRAPTVFLSYASADREAARTFAEKGFEQFQAGDCQAARASFEVE